jgi:hypothetical protein
MAHAAVVEVSIDPTSDVAHRHGILEEFVVPEVRALPGFRRGLWMNDGAGTGTCVVVCSTEDAARATLEVLTREGGPPVIRAGVLEVELEAGEAEA